VIELVAVVYMFLNTSSCREPYCSHSYDKSSARYPTKLLIRPANDRHRGKGRDSYALVVIVIVHTVEEWIDGCRRRCASS